MGERLIKPYEISVWEDKLIQDGATYRFEENKLAVIGSDTMTGLNKVYDPVFNKKTNGERTLTFSLRYKYFDPYSGNSDFINPFAALLVNERKVKLHYDNEWYEFIIKDHTESSDGLEWTYSCTDAFVLELSKTGYNLTFDSELNNNQGTAAELAEKVLENTEWQFGDSGDIFQQLIAEPIYKAQLVGNATIINVNGNEDPIPTPTTDIYLFYSYVKNQSGKFIQFIIRDDNKNYTIDDNNVITDTNFRITDELEYKIRYIAVENPTESPKEQGWYELDNITYILTSDDEVVSGKTYYQIQDKGFWLKNNQIILLGEIENRYQANRLAYNQLTTYDPVMGRTVDRFAVAGDDREVYRYTDYEYTTSNIVMNYITNGENFNVLEDGTLQGWNPYTDQEYEYNQVKNPGSSNPQEKGWYELINEAYVLTTDTTVQSGKTYYRKEQKAVTKLELITYPQLATGKQLADLNILSQVEGYLKTTFNGPYQIVDGNIVNTVYNSGIDNQALFINSISKGDKFVFRWRAGEGELGQLTPVKTLGLIIARYDQDTPTRFGYYYKHIREEDIIVHFTAHASSAELPTANNIIEGGALVTEDNVTNYVIDNVVQTPSTKYLYKSGDDLYAWDGLNGTFNKKTDANYLPYYYTIAEANQSVPNTVLTNSDSNIGIFIYTSEIKTTTTTNNNEQTTTVNPIYIQDIQLTRFVKDEAKSTDENPYPVLIGNIPTATSQPVEYYYFQPEKGAAAEDVETYASAEKLEQRFGLEENSVTPKYNENSEKTLSISASQSNCFNILQTIAETFECWVDLEVEHDDQGYITYGYVLTSDTEINTHKVYYTRSGESPYTYTPVQTPDVEQIATYYEYKPNKYVYLYEYVGKDNYAGFKYGINLSSIERTVNSDEIVTKLIVDQSQSDYVDEGFVSIASAPSNTSGEAYILNFDYYYNQGLLNRTEVEAEKNSFAKQAADLNRQIQEQEKIRIQLENSLTKLQSNRTVFTELVSSAQDNLTQGLEKFKELTGYEYEEYREKYGEVLEEIPTEEIFDTTEDETNEHTCVLQGKPVKKSDIVVTVDGVSFHFEGGKKEKKTGVADVDYDGASTFVVTASLGWPLIHITYVIDIDDLTDEETILDVLGQLYACSSTINNYSGLLTNINEEYWQLRKQLRGNENYSVKYWKVEDDLHQWHICVDVSDYLLGFKFKLGYGDTVDDTWSTYDVTISKKYFDIEPVNHTTIRVQFIPPEGFKTIDGIHLFEEVAQTKAIEATNSQPGIKDEIEALQKTKDQLTNEFNNKYRRFIQEGTWNSTDYIDSELYYLDALQVSNTSAQPQVTYTINVVEISELEGLELYKFDAGDKTYVEDTEFFGWSQVNIGTEAQPQYVLTPAREEVIVSEVEWHLDEPETNVITVQNYKTRFEDLFQRISAAVQTVQYNEATYAKMSTLLDANGTINADVLLNSLNNISGRQYNLTTDGSVLIDGSQITIKNLTNGQNRVIINNEGVLVSSNGGVSWKKVIDGFGVNADAVTTGSINTQQIIIANGDKPSFRWDKAGISAYKAIENEAYDLKTFVRYDQNGLYGIKDGDSLKPYTLNEIKDKAHFAVTWDGFFIKNSYEGGGRVEITSDNDFRVLKTVNNEEKEVIKIGALEWNRSTTPVDGIAPTLYGIRITNDSGVETFKTGTDGNVTITGTINANAGNFDGLVTVGKDENNPSKPYIKIDGTGTNDATISSSRYSQDGTSYGWMINADGDAVFNNITARGAIKTAVFEYAEIQAVGGIFVFRPSSTIRSAAVDGNNLILTVEKPILFKAGQWCKISNYASGSNTTDGEATNPDETNILLNNGLTHVYEVARVQGSNNIILLNGAEMVVGNDAIIESVDELIGGALVDMGNKNGTSNYGIGVNSSDNTVNLPARAISLFETTVDETKEPKVTYNYRGILGTLPVMNSGVDRSVYQHMENTQGIYTDNMYIGDDSQYVAFYEDDNGKQLKIKASQIMFEVSDPAPGEPPWKDIADIEAEGTPGPPGPPGPAGEDAINVVIESTGGNLFIRQNVNTTLRCTVYKGITDITNQVTHFIWSKKDKDGELVNEWSAPDSRSIVINNDDVISKAIFICQVQF